MECWSCRSRSSEQGTILLVGYSARRKRERSAIHVGRTRGEGPIFASERCGERLLGPRHWFEDAVREAGLKNFTWHDLRHCFASRLVMAGVDVRTVAELMGHKRIQMTMRYAHLAPQHKLAAVEKLGSFSSPVKGRDPVILQSVPVENELTPELTPAKIGSLLVSSEKYSKYLLNLANPAHAGT